MSEWKEFFEIIFELEDNRKRGQQDEQRVNAMINRLEKSPMALDRKRRKGRILKYLRSQMRGYSESTRYTRFAIRCAINGYDGEG